MRTLVYSIALLAAVGFVGASADATPRTPIVKSKHKITANGRCNGVSYGTGARRCGTLSGGPSGGNSSKN